MQPCPVQTAEPAVLSCVERFMNSPWLSTFLERGSRSLAKHVYEDLATSAARAGQPTPPAQGCSQGIDQSQRQTPAQLQGWTEPQAQFAGRTRYLHAGSQATGGKVAAADRTKPCSAIGTKPDGYQTVSPVRSPSATYDARRHPPSSAAGDRGLSQWNLEVMRCAKSWVGNYGHLRD